MEHEQLDSWCERVILSFVLLILGFTPLAFGGAPQFGFDPFVVVQWLTVGILAVWLVRFAINSKHRLLWPPVSWAVLAFMGYAVARYLTAEVEYVARQEVIRVLVYGVLYFAVVNNLHRQTMTQWLGVAIIVVATLVSAYAVFQFLAASDYVLSIEKPEGFRKRGSGMFISPNHLAAYLGMILPLSVAFTLTGRFEALMKIFLTYASFVIFAGICVTVSRAGWLASGIALAALFIWLLRERDYWRRGLTVLVVFLVLFGGIFWKADVGPERKERIDNAQRIENARFQIWKPAFAMWKDHWLTGVGPAHFESLFPAYRPAEPTLQTRTERVHNDYLNTLVDWGLIGALLVMACWGLFYYQVTHVWKYVQRSGNDLGGKRSNKAAFVAAGSMGLLAMLVHSFFDFNMHIPANAILMVTMLAIVSSHYRFAGESHWHTVRLPLRIPVNIVLVALLGYLGWQTWIRTGEARALWTAHRSAPKSEAQLAALRAAHGIEPRNFSTTTAIGNLLLASAQPGSGGAKVVAEEALTWFQKSTELNRHLPDGPSGVGRCLGLLGRPDEAEKSFKKAHEVDPNGYLTMAHYGSYYFQRDQLPQAREWLQKSVALMPDEKLNPTPASLLRTIAERLQSSGER